MTVEVGIMIGDRDSWGKGYASEAIKALSSYAFESLNLKKLTAGMYKENLGSQKAFLRSGFSVEGELVSERCYKHKRTNLIKMGLISTPI